MVIVIIVDTINCVFNWNLVLGRMCISQVISQTMQEPEGLLINNFTQV